MHDSEAGVGFKARKGFNWEMSRNRCLFKGGSYTGEQARKQQHNNETSLLVDKPGEGSVTRKSSRSAQYRRGIGKRIVEGQAVGLETGRQGSENKEGFGNQRKSKQGLEKTLISASVSRQQIRTEAGKELSLYRR